MKFTVAVSSLFVLSLAVGVVGCSKKEAPAPVVAEKDKPAPAMTPPVTPPVAPAEKPKPPPADPDRHAAEAVIAMGGAVYVTTGPDKGTNSDTVAGLPPGPFRLLQVYLTGNTKLTDDGLKVFAPGRLHMLQIGNTSVSDAGLAHLASQTELRTLDLSGTKVTDRGLEHIKGMSFLSHLGLAKTQVTGPGLAHIKALPLTALNLTDCPLAENALQNVAQVRNLFSLDLSDTKVSDKGVAELRAMPNLQTLVLKGTAITDEGLRVLKDLPNLDVLDVQGTKVTDAGVADLTKARPKLKVRR